MPSQGPAAEAARAQFRERIEQKGHAVDNVRQAVADLERAFEVGALQRTGEVEEALFDLRLALDLGEGEKLGGKSAEAARLVSRRLARLIEQA